MISRLRSLLTSGLRMAVRHPHSTASHACIIRMLPMPMRPSARQVPRRRSQILGLEDGRMGWIRPEGESA